MTYYTKSSKGQIIKSPLMVTKRPLMGNQTSFNGGYKPIAVRITERLKAVKSIKSIKNLFLFFY